MMFKILHGLVDIPPDKYLISASVKSTHEQKFRQFQAYSDYYKNSFFPRLEFPVGICCRFSLLGILDSPSLVSFKRELSTFIL